MSNIAWFVTHSGNPMAKKYLLIVVVYWFVFAAPFSAVQAQALEVSEQDIFRVLSWNVLHGANDVERGAEKALAIIREVQPDVVLMQESYDIDGDRPTLGRWLAAELGWNAYQDESPHLCVLTPLQLKETFFHDAWHGLGARLIDEQGRELIAYSIWIDYRSYITADLRDNPDISDEELLAAENVRSTRMQEAQAILEHLKTTGQFEADVPLLVGGDWNTPSHLDWTVDTARVFKRRRALALPVSTAVHAAGFTDTFRAVHPNPVQHPGITWSPMFRTSGGKEQGFERIDRVCLKNSQTPNDGWALQPVAAKVLPEVWEDESIPIAEREFPSDHGAVLIDFVWKRSN